MMMRWSFFALLLWPLIIQAQADYTQQILEYRKTRKIRLLEGTNAPLSPQSLSGLRYFPPDPNYRIAGTFERTPDAQPFTMATITGEPEEYVQYGTFQFSWNGANKTLSIYRRLSHIRSPLTRDILFLPFLDTTNGEQTYGGGRYLDLRISDIRGKALTVDFNLAYNPYCVYKEGFSCPRPPIQNTLDFPVKAGEKLFSH